MLRQVEIELLNDVVHNFDNLIIEYNGEAVVSNLIVSSGLIVNTGDVDIDDTMIKNHYLTAILPNETKIHAVDVSDSDIEITPTTTDRKITFGFDLLKKNEYFPFSVIYEDNSYSKYAKNISFSHRIRKVDSAVRQIDARGLYESTNIKSVLLYMFLSMGMMLSIRNVFLENKENLIVFFNTFTGLTDETFPTVALIVLGLLFFVGGASLFIGIVISYIRNIRLAKSINVQKYI